jgi:hypothetical protein
MGAHAIVASVVAIPLAIVAAPTAQAAGVVVYEVTSTYIPSVDIEFTDGSGLTSLQNVPLPWRANVSVDDPFSADTKLNIHWQPTQRYKWVDFRIHSRGSLLCEGQRDAGEASCTARGLYGGVIPSFMPPTDPPGYSSDHWRG